jgi:uncharacterized protein (DUF1697 family)
VPRYAAFLRAINVGGRVVKMERLRELFETLAFQNVATFIASGNVIFESRNTNPGELEAQIEHLLMTGLGYEVATFVRSTTEVANIAVRGPAAHGEIEAGARLYVAFMRQSADRARQQAALALKGPLDELHFQERELYWLVRKQQFLESAITGAALERVLNSPITVRSSNTVRKIAARYPPL